MISLARISPMRCDKVICVHSAVVTIVAIFVDAAARTDVAATCNRRLPVVVQVRPRWELSGPLSDASDSSNNTNKTYQCATVRLCM